jgi:diguanylate cyclase (GGDEF)-like protein
VPILSIENKPEVLRFGGGTDADLRLGWQEFLLRIIADAFDLPPFLLGVEHDVNRSTAEEATQQAFRNAVIPTARLLAEHITREARGGASFQVALVDIDYFKKVNDTYGHRVGDEALVGFARQARAQLRSIDIVARWGGEEFLLLLPESAQGDPNVGIERLRRAMAGTELSVAAPQLRVAFSSGLTRYVSGEAIDDMIERADRALYLSKSGGRNRTTVL